MVIFFFSIVPRFDTIKLLKRNNIEEAAHTYGMSRCCFLVCKKMKPRREGEKSESPSFFNEEDDLRKKKMKIKKTFFLQKE